MASRVLGGEVRRRRLTVLIATLGLIAAGLAVALVLKSQRKAQESARPSLVRYEGKLAPAALVAGGEGVAVDAGALGDAIEPERVVEVDSSVGTSSTSRKKPLPCADKEGPEERNPCLLEGRTGALAVCLKKHAPADQGGITLRIRLSQSGKVNAVELSPPQLQATPLHSCVAKIVKRVDFGRQKGQVQMVVPLHWE